MQTKDNKKLAIKELTCDEMIDNLKLVAPHLAATLKKLSKRIDNATFYVARYLYGSKIINNKKAYLPLENGESIAFDDPQLPEAVRNNLFYDPATQDPLGIILNKTSEFYLLGENRIQPHSIIIPGQMFGIARAIDNSPYTSSALEANLNAGARSVFMLSKISDQTHHNRLQDKYAIKSTAPTSPQEHWNVFTELNKQAENPWYTEVIYFPRDLINKIKTDEYATLDVCLTQMHRGAYDILHRASRAWDKAFHDIEESKNLNKYYSMQSLMTSKQLFKMAADVVLGFKPALTDESAPVSLIEEVYKDTYNKSAKHKYTPIIMEPCKFSLQNNEPIYDSLNYATFTENHLNSTKKKSHLTSLDEIRIITELYAKGILETKSDVPSLYNIAKNVSFTYYHPNPESYDQIKNIALLENEDKRFAHKEAEEFPLNAPFFTGCIQISRADSNAENLDNSKT